MVSLETQTTQAVASRIRTVLNRVVAAVVQQLLGTLHSHGALGGNQGGRLDGGGQRGGLGLVHLADEAGGEGLGGAEVAGGQGQLFDPRQAADDLGQTRERADVGGQPDVDLLDGEARVLGADTDVGAARDVDGQPDRDAVQDADDS